MNFSSIVGLHKEPKQFVSPEGNVLNLKRTSQFTFAGQALIGAGSLALVSVSAAKYFANRTILLSFTKNAVLATTLAISGVALLALAPRLGFKADLKSTQETMATWSRGGWFSNETSYGGKTITQWEREIPESRKNLAECVKAVNSDKLQTETIAAARHIAKYILFIGPENFLNAKFVQAYLKSDEGREKGNVSREEGKLKTEYYHKGMLSSGFYETPVEEGARGILASIIASPNLSESTQKAIIKLAETKLEKPAQV